MKGAIIGGLIAAILDIAINVVSDNLTNPWAWVVFIIAVFASALVGQNVEGKISQKASMIGKENDIQQDLETHGLQTARTIGKKNNIKQNIKK